MPRRFITPTDNPYMWNDVTSYVLREDEHKGIEMEDQSGYIMLESWTGTIEADIGPELSADVIKVRNILRAWRM